MNRRSFLGTTAAALAATGLASAIPATLQAAARKKGISMPIGFQSYVFREEISNQPHETMSRLAGYGYKNVEWCSPKGYQGPFAPLAKYSGKELKKITNDAGLESTSCHFTWQEITNDESLKERIEFAHQLGLKHMVCSGGLGAKTADEIKQRCAQMNHVGEMVKKAGMIAGYHNHNGEFDEKINGRPQYDLMLEQLDPAMVKMQFQVAAITSGYKAQDYFRKFPGRFISAHLQDYSPTDHTKEVVMGTGIVDWKDFFAAVKTGGLQYIFVEMESDQSIMQGCADYLKQL
ncbi:sugar phosphate isomerase/epimerase [Panacibacter sp. DH6]|uniref:Sugar phosphate isomerase/epimerase n=1 Tax=Panacibacter microcysteis TaxID=2793269 RepID=A0A931GXM5_9BACT|nr:TIM barrel protein [Panacibacter microcysteis]MBG9376109.1 sugar phosphate isomerase/epimerase [Panacibacter microcysteis]